MMHLKEINELKLSEIHQPVELSDLFAPVDDSPKSFSTPSLKYFLAENRQISLTVTQKFLTQFPLNQILERADTQDGIDLSPFIPTFNRAIAEERTGFFGYHATTMKHWLFNEIVRQVLQQPLRDDFYFLRAPSETYSEVRNVSAFFNEFSTKKLTLEEKRAFISSFLLKPIGRTDLSYDDVTACRIYETLLFYSNGAPQLTREETEAALTLFLGSSKALTKWFEDPNQERFENQRTGQEHALIIEVLYPVCDVWKEQQKRLVSLNLALYGNYEIESESTIHVFAKGESVDFGSDAGIMKSAIDFLTTHGYSEKTAREIFEEAGKIVDLKQGILLQFFDDAAYSHLDRFAYLCSNFGHRIEGSPSQFLSQYDPTHQIERAEESPIGPITFHPQLRLLMTKETLSASWLKIKQYDLVPQEIKQRLRTLISQYLQKNN